MGSMPIHMKKSKYPAETHEPIQILKVLRQKCCILAMDYLLLIILLYSIIYYTTCLSISCDLMPERLGRGQLLSMPRVHPQHELKCSTSHEVKCSTLVHHMKLNVPVVNYFEIRQKEDRLYVRA